jgi:hypothetical protein
MVDWKAFEESLKMVKDRDLHPTEEQLNMIDEDQQTFAEIYNLHSYELEMRNLVLMTIREELNQFTLFKEYTAEDYDKAMRNINQLLDEVAI